jgi:GT2 family glycosyltransferase
MKPSVAVGHRLNWLRRRVFEKSGGRGEMRKSTRAVGNSSKESTDLEELRHDLDALAGQVDSVLRSEDWIQAKLYDLNLSLATLVRAQPPAASEAQAASIAPPPADPAYYDCVRRIRETVRRALPRDATVVVVSKGDEGLLDLYGRRGWHFPQASNGEYLWYYLPDGPPVVAQLETLRMQGAQYLLFPKPAFWWLDRYPEFTSHLRNHYPVIVEDEKACLIFAIEESYATLDAGSWTARLPELVTDHIHETGAEPAILDWNTGLHLKERFPNQAVFTPPDDEPRLPYLDQSVDIVVVTSSDKAVLREARRVASYAIVEVASPDQAGDDAPPDDDHHLEATVERIGERADAGGMPSSSIIIPTHDGLDHLRLCLASLEEALPEPFRGEVIVVDDASGGEMQAFLKERQASLPYLKVIRSAQNRGFVASCNRGARTATGDILIFLNDDTIPQTGWLRALLRTFREHPDAGAVGGKLIYPDGRLQEAGNSVFSDGSAANIGRDDRAIEAPHYNYLREVDYCSGALLATPRALFSEIGGFDKRYAPGYYEDTDYCFEVRKHGYRVYYQPESVVVHTEGGTGGTDLTSGAKRFQVVNHEKFARKWKDALRAQPKPVSS